MMLDWHCSLTLNEISLRSTSSNQYALDLAAMSLRHLNAIIFLLSYQSVLVKSLMDLIARLNSVL